MYKNNKRYYTINEYLKTHFDQKVIKLAVDGSFTCPNRDGTIGYQGCIFCDEMGSGAFAGCKSKTIGDQMRDQIELLKDKWPEAKYIAYFQNFTNTYDSVENLRKKYDEALSFDGVVGLAIATRPDCLGKGVLDLLSEYNERTHLWVEMGLQTIHNSSASWINRGYGLEIFEDAFTKLSELGVKSVIHLIYGLPGESTEDMLASCSYVSKLKPFGVKLHLLHVIEGTQLARVYEENPFKMMNLDEYLYILSESIKILDPEITVHRITGDGKKDTLVAPRWTLNKRSVLNGLDKRLKLEDIFQGQLSK